jgi:hypothetical protein
MANAIMKLNTTQSFCAFGGRTAPISAVDRGHTVPTFWRLLS